MDLSTFKLRNIGSWRASKLATLACFLATGALLASALLQDNRFADELSAIAGQLF